MITKPYLSYEAYPELFNEWDYERNDGMPENYTEGNSKEKKYWKCSVNPNHKWEATINSRVNGVGGCPYCRGRKVLIGDNDFKTHCPEKAALWDYDKNDKKPEEVYKTSTVKYWFICKKGHAYQASPGQQSAANECCPYCNNHNLLSGFNDLLTKYPKVAEDWDTEKNGIGPDQVLFGSTKKAYWKCHKCGREYTATPASKTIQEHQCKACIGKTVRKGFNDLEHCFPEIATEYSSKNALPPNEIARFTSKKVIWNCKHGHEWEASVISRTKLGSGCPSCNQKIRHSFPEMAIYYYINQVFPDAISGYKIPKGYNAEYDVFIPSILVAVEYDGAAYHTNPNQDLRKDKRAKEDGITLYRIREKNCQELNSSSIILQLKEQNNYEELEYYIYYIISQYSNIEIDININRDKMVIQSLSATFQHKKSLQSLCPDIAGLWDYEQNYPLTPDKIASKSGIICNWVCPHCGETFQRAVESLTRAKIPRCPLCKSDLIN